MSIWSSIRRSTRGGRRSTPKIGGKFVKLGEHFVRGGNRYEVAQLVDNKIIAHEASGAVEKAHTIVIDAKTVAGEAHAPDDVLPAPTMKIKGGRRPDPTLGCSTPRSIRARCSLTPIGSSRSFAAHIRRDRRGSRAI